MQATKIKKFSIALLAVIVLGAASYYGYKKYTSSKATATAKFATAKVKRTDIAVTVEGTGSVTSSEETDIYSSNGGIVQQLPFKLGDTVKSGDLFCSIEDTNSQKNIDTDKNNIAQKTLDLKNLEITLDNLYIKAPIDGTVKSVYAAAGDDVASLKPAYGGLAIITAGSDGSLEIPIPFPQSGKISQVYVSSGSSVKKGDTLFKLDDSTIKNNMEAIKLQIQQLQNDLNTQQKNLSKTSIVCPKDGIISTLNIKQGDYVDNTKLIAAIINPSSLEVVVPIDEMDIDKVKVGEDATIKADGIKDKTYTGHVEKISQTGKTTNNVTTYDVTLSLDNSERLKVGMNVNVTISVEKKTNVLAVPTEAVTERNGKKYVLVQSSSSGNGSNNKGTSNFQNNNGTNNNGNSNSQSYSGSSGNNSQSRNGSSRQSSTNRNLTSIPGRSVEVQTGIQNQNMVEILSGLTENETVIIQFPQSSNSNQNMMRNGANGFGGTGFGGSGTGAARTSGGGASSGGSKN